MHINAPTIQIGVLGVDFSRLIPGIIIISMNSGAYVSETVRAGINAVPKRSIRGGLLSKGFVLKCHALCHLATGHQEYLARPWGMSLLPLSG